jgi:alpha-mannosidase
VHDFTYSIYPHAGDWKKSGTVQAAYELNCPAYTMVETAHEGKLPAELSLVSLDKENVIIEVVKKAEDSNDLIIRVYECYNRRTTAKFTFLKDISAVWECDLMENNIEPLEFSKNSFSFDIKPYEIKTFKLKV